MRPLLWLVPLTVFVAVGTFFAGGGHDGFTTGGWMSVGLAVLACLTLYPNPWPAGSMVALRVVEGAYFALGFHDGPVFLPLLLGSNLVASRLGLRQWVPPAGLAAGLVVVGLLVRTATSGAGWWQTLWQTVGTVALMAAAATIGSLVRSRRQTQAEREHRAATEEKLRMARDLHDGVGHGLSVIAMQAGVALHVLDKDPAGARAALQAIRDTSTEALESLRAELSHLAGDAARRAPRRGLADLDQLVGRVRAAGLRVEVRGLDTVGRPGAAPRVPAGEGLPAAVDEAAYTIIQEALTNVLRHAEARTVEVRVARAAGGALLVCVADDGRGGAVQHEGMGLTGMRDRVGALGGTLSAGPAASGGFEVRAVLPL